MFITFEGIDGSGKSTQIKLLAEKLEEHGHNVHVFREPGGTALSEKVRSLLLDSDLDIHPITELLLFSAARAQLVAEEVKPILERDEIVILDRYYDSTIAYQGYGRKSLPIDDIHQLNAIATQNVQPDVTFYLKIDLEEAERRTASKQKDRMERAGTNFYTEVMEGFDRLAGAEERIVEIDSGGSANHTHQLIIKAMQNQFGITL